MEIINNFMFECDPSRDLPFRSGVHPVVRTYRVHSSTYDGYSKRPKQWNVKDVAEWLKLIGLEKYAEKFSSNHVRGEVLLEMDMSDFEDIGINEDDRPYLEGFIDSLK